jgi:hypothetical protein
MLFGLRARTSTTTIRSCSSSFAIHLILGGQEKSGQRRYPPTAFCY